MSRIKLFCFPYAGGSAVIYNQWKKYVDPIIEIRPIELAGRGKRINEQLYNGVPEVIEDVWNILKDEIKESRYALFGHSMGAMIAYELAQKIREDNYPGASHIFFSGRSAPHVEREDEKKYHLMPEDKFRSEIIELGGTPPEFFDHLELLEVFLPLLKNDFKLAETNLHNGEIKPLNTNISIFLGKYDDLTTEQCDGWKKHSTKLCTIHYFEGGHFFLHDETKQLVRLINNTLVGNIYV